MLKLGIIKFSNTPSLSTIIYDAAFQHLNINGEYKVYEVKPEELENLLKELKKEKVRGVNVTIPHKINIIPLLDELTDRAKEIGAVNTVTFNDDGKTIGDNTDASGFWDAMPISIRKNIAGKNVAILGCGGAAHACAMALLLNNVSQINIYGRNKDKLERFKNFLESKNKSTKIQVDLVSNINLSNTFMLVNTTPVGMYPNIDQCLVTKKDLQYLPSDAFVYDIIYNPPKTKLLQYAKSLDLKTLNGVEMLVNQGAESLNIWLGKDVAPIIIMKNALIIETHGRASLRANNR
ncbi:MAG: shikimate dehydrogenase [Candidatus Melainabacteria bacterium]|nr:shikimate dehydrogenase [Candidatus Melainabacteria bacterium]